MHDIQERDGLTALIGAASMGKSFPVGACVDYGASNIISTLIRTKEVEWIGIDNLNNFLFEQLSEQ